MSVSGLGRLRPEDLEQGRQDPAARLPVDTHPTLAGLAGLAGDDWVARQTEQWRVEQAAREVRQGWLRAVASSLVIGLALAAGYWIW